MTQSSNYKSSRPHKRDDGFTLIEIVVAVLILAVGILGAAGMQSVGVRESQNSYFRSQANLLAIDMADKMRANRQEAVRGNNSAYLNNAPASPSCNYGMSDCDTTSVAELDLYGWKQAIEGSGLPNPSHAINLVSEIVDGTGTVVSTVYDIQLRWDEKRQGGDSYDCQSGIGCVSWRIQI